MIKVSVIMPVYNSERYLEEALECLVHQTLKEIEMICVDDGSTDSSPDILNKYAAMDSRIRILTQENSGAGAARNLGIQHATGEYLSILDSDDIFEYDMLETAYAKAKKDMVDICVFKMDKFKENPKYRRPCHWALSKEQVPDFEPFTYKDIKGNIFVVFMGWTWDKLFRREFISAHQLKFQSLRTTNDMFFTFTALVKAEKITTLSRTLVHQRGYLKDSLSATREKSWDDFYHALTALKEELINIGIYKEVERSYINYALQFSVWQLDTLDVPAFYDLYEKLKQEIFVELGISTKKQDFFEDKEKYRKYKQIMDWTPEKYRIKNEIRPTYKEYYYQFKETEKKINPKVSILIPIYNIGHYLVECLNSVVNQTLEDIEIICINDGSTDNSLEIVKKYAMQDKRIVILDEVNGGYGKAMNRGLNVAKGVYIGIVEPDDYIDLNMYETLYQIAVEKDLDIIKADFNSFRDMAGKRQFVQEQIAGLNPDLYNQVISAKSHPIILKFPLYTWSGIYKRSFINSNHIRHNETPGASYQDNGFWFQTFCFAERIFFLNKIFYQYRRDNPNSSVCDKSKVYCICEEYRYIYNFLEKYPEFKQRYIGYYQYRRYYNYILTFYRISDEKKWEFVNRFYEEFRESYEKRELPEEIFDDLEWDTIRDLLDSPVDFYAHYYAKEDVQQLRREVELLKASKSWKIGSAVVYLPKKILGR